MNYKSYDTKQKSPQRMTRKRARSVTFMTNKKARKLLKKKRKEALAELAAYDQEISI